MDLSKRVDALERLLADLKKDEAHLETGMSEADKRLYRELADKSYPFRTGGEGLETEEKRFITESEFLEQMLAVTFLDGKRQSQIRVLSVFTALNLLLTTILYFVK